MALPSKHHPWPVPVRYAWADGADLMARTIGPREKIVREVVAVPNAELERRSWADLPHHDAAQNRIEYWVDVPGDDRLDRTGTSGWQARWRALSKVDGAAAHDVSASPYPPTQYAHVSWIDRERGLLSIQYWFFYPFDEWVNHHEGDWEHITVVLSGPQRLTAEARFRPVGYQFFFHGWKYEPSPAEVVRVGGRTPDEDHVVVFTGGRGRLLWWAGTVSGGSYPLPALYPGAAHGIGKLGPADDTRDPERFIAADQFDVVVLPEPNRLNAAAHPELSWLRLPFFAGAQRVHRNPVVLDLLGRGGAPSQPAQRGAWRGLDGKPTWRNKPVLGSAGVVLPRTWARLDARSGLGVVATAD